MLGLWQLEYGARIGERAELEGGRALAELERRLPTALYVVSGVPLPAWSIRPKEPPCAYLLERPSELDLELCARRELLLLSTDFAFCFPCTHESGQFLPWALYSARAAQAPPTPAWVEALFELELCELPEDLRTRFDGVRRASRLVGVDDAPGECVVVVGESAGRWLYWSDVEEGWALEAPTERATIASRDCSQFELRHIAQQLDGASP